MTLIRSNKALLACVALVVAACAGLGFYLWGTPKRVWVTYTEKWQDYPGGEDYKRDAEWDAALKLSAEQQLKPCVVLTHDRQNADYIVSISVVRYGSSTLPGLREPPPGLAPYGQAWLSIAKRNGDVMLVDSFLQNQNSAEDIGQQPVIRAREFVCHQKHRILLPRLPSGSHP